jgi:L-2,4-diaminobutyrate transaminase
MTVSPESIADLDRKFMFHPFTALKAHEESGPPRVIVQGRGTTLTDLEGRTYLDAMAGLWCVNIGYSDPRMAEALRKQTETLSYYHAFGSMSTDVPARLAERLVRMSPVPMSKVFFGNSGSDANDTQVKIVWYYNNVLGRPEKKKIISRQRGYHGVTVMTGGLTGLRNLHDDFDLPLPMIRHTRPPHRIWEAEPGMSDAEFVASLVADLEKLIVDEGPETVAAFIVEPVQAAGGVIVPPETYFTEVQKVLKKYDVLLIADEVVTGFGRLGQMFGSSVFEIEPDLITVAKGITSAYIPLSACLVSEKIWRALADGGGRNGVFGHGYTYSAHPLAAAAAMMNLDILEKDHLLNQVNVRGDFMQRRLREEFSDHPIVGEVRGMGLIGAVEFVAAKNPVKAFSTDLKVASRITRRCLELGMITRALPAADTIAFSPPFVVTEDEIDSMITIARRAVDEIATELNN